MLTRAYENGKLVVAMGCPVCGGSLIALKCQRPTCGKQWESLGDIQEADELFANIRAEIEAANAIRAAAVKEGKDTK